MDVIGVTNRKLCKDFYEQIRKIAKCDLKYLILREKDLKEEELEIMASRVKGILKQTEIKLIINTNIKIADNVNAYGIQLSFNDFIEKDIKKFQGIVGVSVHSLEEALEAENKNADYIIYGHIFETECKKGVCPRGDRKSVV